MKSALNAILIAGLLTGTARAQTNKTTPGANARPASTNARPGLATTATNAVPEAKTDKDSISYAIGMYFGNMIKRNGTEVDFDTLTRAIKDITTGATPRFTEPEAQQILMAMQRDAQMKKEAENKIAGEKNTKEGETFLAANAKKPGVKTTESGLQYKVITEGKGPKAKSSDTVSAHYRGHLINGEEFDSSYKRNQPMEFPVTGVIPGWIEALQLMNVGSKWELYIPSKLAYGERGHGQAIAPNSTLIFEIELLGVKEPPKPSTNDATQAVSGEIIKVPSKAELDKGAKIEVIRPGQTNEVKPK